MSVSSYRLEAARPRPHPPPLQFKDSSYQSTSSSLSSQQQDSQTLLYNLPSPPSMPSPPPSSPRRNRLTSPSSPSFPGRSRTPISGGRTTPISSARNRSTTPLGVSQSELERFAGHCRAWYFDQDEDAGRLMTQTLTSLPPSQRAPFSRLQASIRSAFHQSVNARKTAEFRAHLSATSPGGSLSPASRADPYGALAQKERYDRFDQFVRTWCTMGMPGTQPFFEGLWGIMRLEVVPQHLGGAGALRIEWVLDDAVFKEAAGKDFMLEAIDVLKGVLGFEELSSSKCPSPSPNYDDAIGSPAHLRTQSQPLSSLSNRASIAAPMVQPKRARAPSDPFIDTPALSESAPLPPSRPSGSTAAAKTINLDGAPEPLSPSTDTDEARNIPWRSDFQDSDLEEDSLRIWTSPDISNPEYLSLLQLFPTFITRRALPRFPVTPDSRRTADIEEGEDEPELCEVRVGTGTIRLGPKVRSDGWEGGWWTRFIMWLRRIFC
ncbi:hypothetical protein EYR38_006587 [Pleurotus pulmonarius]|nr:hypothetical protein EYR38_006587 [Pleurotus pulmonarius]